MTIAKEMIEELSELSPEAFQLLEMAILINYDDINEAIDFGKMLKKIGFKAHKGTPGLIEIVAKSGKNIAKLLWLAAKAVRSKEERAALKDHIKSMKVSKEDLLNFLYKLDLVTLHAITGPLHAIDAVTGWEIVPNLQSAATKTNSLILKAINQLKVASKRLAGKAKEKMDGLISSIDDLVSPPMLPAPQLV